MSLFSSYNNARAVTDPHYAWDTASDQAIIGELSKIRIELERLNHFLATDLGEVLVAIHNKIK